MSERFPGVLIKPKSANRKLGPVDIIKTPELKRARLVPRAPYVASTYVSIKGTCDDACKFKDAGCFAESGYTGLMVARLDGEVTRKRGNIGIEEAAAIDTLFPRGVPQDGGKYGKAGRDLRLHVSGDAEDEQAAIALSLAAARYRTRGGGVVWTYTHAWRRIPRSMWGPIEVLASVETVKDIDRARFIRGYVPTLVVREFPTRKVFSVPGTEVRFIPCPAETKKTTCTQCRLCFDTARLYKDKLGIAFAVHGKDRNKAKKKLPIYGTLFGTIE